MRNLSNLYVDGVVGVGTTSPLRKLHVVGDLAINASGSQYYGVYINGVGEGANPNILIGDWHNSSANITWDSTNNLLRIDAQHSTSGAPIVFSGNDAALEYARFTSTGNLGIGTTSPAQKLHISGGHVRLNAAGDRIEFQNSNVHITRSGNEMYMAAYSGWRFYDMQGSSTRMLLTSSGNLLIGTTTDAGYKLDVAGNARANNVILGTDQTYGGNYRSVSFGNNADGANRIFATSDTGDGMYFAAATGRGFRFRPNGGSSDLLTIDSSGNLGIGTTAPVSQLDITKTFNARAGVQSNPTGGASVAIDYQTSSDIQGRIRSRDWDAAAWKNFTIEANNILLSPAGNVGIGTTSPSRTLDVNGEIQNNGIFRRSGNVIIKSTGSETMIGPGGSGVVSFHNNSTMTTSDETMRITSAGNVGIGTISPNNELEILGSNSPRISLRSSNEAVGEALELGFQVGTGANASSNTVGLIKSVITQADPSTLIGDLEFQTNSGDSASTKMIIKGNGNVGIGTSSPGAQLHVSSASSSATSVYVGNTGTGVSRVYFDASNGDFSGGDYMWIGQNNDLSGEIVMTQSAGAFHIKTQPGGTITSRLTVLQDGNVGIGTTSPAAKLHVVGTGQFGDYALIGTSIPAGFFMDTWNGAFRANGTSGDKGFYFQSYNGSNTYMYVGLNGSYAGNVGIGTTSPGAKLDVVGSIWLSGRVEGRAFPYNSTFGSGADATTTTLDAGSTNTYRSSIVLAGGSATDPNTIKFLTTSAERMRITSAGNVGIGTTSPDTNLEVEVSSAGGGPHTYSRFHVKGDTYAAISIGSPNNGYGWYMFGDTDDSYVGGMAYDHAVDAMYFNVNNNTALYVNSSRNIGIGTTSPANQLHIVSASNNSSALIIQDDARRLQLGRDMIEARSLDGTTVQNLYIQPNGNVGISTSSGNVGIGTTSPSHKLHVNGGNIFGSSNVLASNNVYAAGPQGFVFGSSTSEGEYIYRSGNDIRIHANSGDRLTVLGTGNVGIGTTSPTGKLHVVGSVNAGGKVFYSKSYPSLDTTGVAIAGLTTGGNGSSALYEFTMYGGTGGYQRVVYSCQNAGGNWYAYKVIDEGTNNLDVEASASGLTITFTFKARSATQYYSPGVHVEFLGSNIDTSYL